MYLGIDLGTGSVKVMLLDRSGAETSASAEYPVVAPREQHAETQPEDWLDALATALAELDRRGGESGIGGLDQVEAIGFSGQMHGVVPARIQGPDRTPQALRPAILWADQRSSEELQRYNDLDPGVLHQLGNRPASGMTGPTLLWLIKHEPEVLAAADTVLFPKDFVRATLTGSAVTDHSDASGSVLYDFSSRGWHGDAIAQMGIPGRLLPEIQESSEDAGRVTETAARRFGLPSGIPVVAGAGDTPAAMYGTGLTDPDVAQVSVGTAAQVARPVLPGVLPNLSSLNLFEGAEPALRYQVAAMLNGGLALEWVRRRLGYTWDQLYQDLEDRVTSDPGDLTFLPYLTGERTPYLNPSARASWTGMTLHHDNLDLAQAALIGVACTVRLGLETLEEGRATAAAIRLVGGSARFPVWRDLLSIVLARDLHFSEQTDSSARGAAYMAASFLDGRIPSGPRFQPHRTIRAPWAEDYFHRFVERYRQLHP